MSDAVAVVGMDTSAYTAGEQQINQSNLRIAADAAATEQKINAARQANENNLAGSLLRGERRVATSAAFVAQQLANVQTPAQGVAVALEGAARIFQVGFGATVGIFAAYATFVKLDEQIRATDKSAKELARQLAIPATVVADLPVGQIRATADAFTKALTDLAEKKASFGSQLQDFADKFLKPAVGTSSQNVGAGKQSEVDSAAKRLGQTLQDQAAAEEKITAIRATGLSVSKEEGDLSEIELKKENQIAEIEKQRIAFKLALFDTKVSPDIRDPLITENDQAAARLKKNAEDNAALSVKADTQKAELTKFILESETRAADFRGTAEQKTLNTLQEQLKVAEKIAQTAAESGTKEDRTAAAKGEADAQAALASFVKETAFKDQEELSSAKALTEEMDLRARGEERAAKLVETREKFEREIAADIHAGNLELANQAALQEKIAVAQQLGQTLTRTPQQINQEAAQAAVLSNQQRVGEQTINSALADIARGARLDASSAVAQAIKALDQPKPVAAKSPETEQLVTLNTTAADILKRIGGTPSGTSTPTTTGTAPTTAPTPAPTSAPQVGDFTDRFNKVFGSTHLDAQGNPILAVQNPISLPIDWKAFDGAFHTASQGASKDFQELLAGASKDGMGTFQDSFKGASEDFKNAFGDKSATIAKNLQDAAGLSSGGAPANSASGQNLIDMLRQDVAHGARLDPAQQKILDAANAAIKDTGTTKGPAGDFSSLASLAGKDFSGIELLNGSDFSGIESLASSDFSSLDALSQMDFSGLSALDGLSISIA